MDADVIMSGPDSFFALFPKKTLVGDVNVLGQLHAPNTLHMAYLNLTSDYLSGSRQPCYLLVIQLTPLQARAPSELLPRMASSHDGVVYGSQHTLLLLGSRPCLLDQSHLAASAIVFDCSVPFFYCSGSRFRLLLIFSDCSVPLFDCSGSCF